MKVAPIALALTILGAACAPGDAGDVTSGDPAQSIIEDVIYGHKLGMALTLDVYRPAAPNGAGVLFINSGGYVSPAIPFLTEDSAGVRMRTDGEMGEDLVQFSLRPLLEAGYTVFDVHHGSSPRFLVPEAVDDVRYAVRFVRDHASEYDVDPERLGVWGGSAGGHLALMLGTTAEVAPSTDEAAAPAPVAAVVAYYPPSDFALARVDAAEWARQNYNVDLFQVFPSAAFPEDRDPEFSPSMFATEDDAPTLIIHGDLDPLVLLEQGEIMHEALVTAGVATELVVIEGADHAFLGSDAEFALERVVAWFDEHLR